MSALRAWVAITLLACTCPLAADWTFRYDEVFEVEGEPDATRRSEATLWFDETRARFDSPRLGTLILDEEAGTLLHVRRDGTGVLFPFPLDLAQLVPAEEREDFEQVQALFGTGETTTTDSSETRTIQGHSAVWVETTTVYAFGGASDAKLWLAKDLAGGDIAARLLSAAGQLQFGMSPWLETLGQKGRVPLEIEATRQGMGASQTQTFRLVNVSRGDLADGLFRMPEEVEMVPFRLEDYFRLGPPADPRGSSRAFK